MTPDGWRAVKLGDVLMTTIGGGTPSRSNVDFWSGSIPWATVKDFGPRVLFETQERITEEGLRNSASNLVPPNTIVVATRMNVGAVFRSGVPIAINQDLRALVPAETLCSDYLFYFLQANGSSLSQLATGTTVKGLGVNTLRSHPLPLPPVPEQRKIAAILSSVDDAIEKTQAVIDHLQVVKRSLMQVLLTRGLPGRHRRFKQTEIGEIPKVWETVSLGELACVNPEQLGNPTDPDQVIEYLDITAIQRPGVIGPSRTLNFAAAPSRARRKTRAGDILVSTVRPYLRNFARIRESAGNLVVSTGYAVVRPGNQVDGNFLYQHVMSDGFVEFLKTRMRGSNYPAVKGDDVEDYMLPLPPLIEQRKIGTIFSIMDDAIETNREAIDNLQVLKGGLMSVLLNGELRVTPDPEVA